MPLNKIPPVESVRASSLTRYGMLMACLCLAAAGSYIAVNWNQWLLMTIDWQKALHQAMAELLQQVKESPSQVGGVLLICSFGYGVFHALGPGHGKVVITTYLATHPARLGSSVRLTLLAALLQSMVAIGLVSLVLGILKLSSRYLHQSSFWLEKASYGLVVLLGIFLCWRALKRGMKVWRITQRIMSIQEDNIAKTHQHPLGCDCGHRHIPSEAELSDTHWHTQLAVVVSMGMRPCSGAILVLLFAKVIDVYLWGLLAAIAMGAGTALTISAIALVVHTARQLARSWAQRQGRYFSPYWETGCMLLGGMILIVTGLLLYQSVSFMGIGSPLFR